MPNKLNRFWQEVKRRNVVRVITVYIAASLAILELVSNISEPFGLPDWTLKLVFVILVIGLILAIILSWIYDLHPEGGMVKTEPADKVKAEDIPKSSSGWKIASYISFVVIVGLIVLNIIPRSGKKEILEKSIAILPLDYLSENPNKEYLANGVLDAITGHLSTLEGLRVMPRTSVEQYRDSKKSAKEIGEELDVSYLIEGSFLMVDDQVKLTIQLVVAKEGDHIFFKEYDRDYSDIFAVQSEVAQTIAKEIEIVLTPEEKQLIEKIPTTNLTAHDFYLRGNEEQSKYSRFNQTTRSVLERATYWYKKALEYDPEYAQAYIGLARTYWDKHYFKDFFSENFQDSAIIYCDVALSFDNQLAEAYSIKGTYYSEIGKSEQALEEFAKATQYNPNDWSVYYGKGLLYRQVDLVKAIDNFQKAASLNRGDQLPDLLRFSIGSEFTQAGFPEKALNYYKEALNLDGDSAKYYYVLGINEFFCGGNFQKAVEYAHKGYSIDSTNQFGLVVLILSNVFLGNHPESLKYLNKHLEFNNSIGVIDYVNEWIFGYIFWKNGNKEKADYFFDETVKNSNRIIDLGRTYAQSPEVYYDLAAIYAFRGEPKKAFMNLKILSQKPCVEIKWGTLLRNDPLFSSIRDEPEFQQIVRNVESKYQAEHERVRQWLEETDLK